MKKIFFIALVFCSYAFAGETVVNCSFPDHQITANTNFSITLTNNGCSVLSRN